NGRDGVAIHTNNHLGHTAETVGGIYGNLARIQRGNLAGRGQRNGGWCPIDADRTRGRTHVAGNVKGLARYGQAGAFAGYRGVLRAACNSGQSVGALVVDRNIGVVPSSGIGWWAQRNGDYRWRVIDAERAGWRS